MRSDIFYTIKNERRHIIKWVNHKVITLSGVYLVTKNPVYLMSSYLGSTFPDALEGNYGRQINFKNHRQLTHWYIPYLLVTIVVLILKEVDLLVTETIKITYNGLLFFLYGSLLHLFLDAFTGTIPSTNPVNYKKRLGKRLIKSETAEYFLSLLALFILFLIEKYR